jgi:hypothetical protein
MADKEAKLAAAAGTTSDKSMLPKMLKKPLKKQQIGSNTSTQEGAQNRMDTQMAQIPACTRD